MSVGRLVRATYRLQVQSLGSAGRPGLRRAAELVPYLEALGVDTVYLSPVFAARPGSTHGYDVVDPTVVDPALGGRRALDDLLAVLEERQMGVLFDIVPNHMATHAANPYWWDVLRHGRGSQWAAMFDIDWPAQHDRVLLPVLGAPFGEVLEAGELRVEPSGCRAPGDEPVLRYHEHVFPLAPGTLAKVLGDTALDDTALEGVGPLLGGRAGRPASFDRLEHLLDLQHFRLAFWRLARLEGNYRRFFDIDQLIGVRQEDDTVFATTHALVGELATKGPVTGVRVDHVDGLADPGGYLARLGDLLDGKTVVVEKILARGERLPAWPVDGTTGYEFADLAGGLFVDAEGAARLAGLAQSAGTGAGDAGDLEVAGRRFVLDWLFAGQRDRLVRDLQRAAATSRHGRDLSTEAIRHAVEALLAHLRVYRTYSTGQPLRGEYRRRAAEAADVARTELEGDALRALEVLVRRLTGVPWREADGYAGGREAAPDPWADAVTRWQQLASAVAAKGVEDTAYYRFAGLLSAAEVGGMPSDPAVAPPVFHAAMAARARHMARGLNATSTHDSKRSEDVRCRIAVLSEMAADWERAVVRWHRRHAPWTSDSSGTRLRFDTELVLYQSLFGAWPAPGGRLGTGADGHGWEDFVERMLGFASKAAHEARRETSWRIRDPAYEALLESFVHRLLEPADNAFCREMTRIVRRAAPSAVTSSLALLALKVTAPGIPDFYEGSEDVLLALVDPDNRRSVDFDGLAERLAALERVSRLDAPARAWAIGSMAAARPGDLKLLVTHRLLQARRAQPELFAAGSYVPLEVHGRLADHVVAFARRRGRAWSVTIVARRTLGLVERGRFVTAERWGETAVALPETAPRRFTDAVTGAEVRPARGRLSVPDALGVLPVAVLLPAARS